MIEGINALQQHLVGLEGCHDGVRSLYLGAVIGRRAVAKVLLCFLRDR